MCSFCPLYEYVERFITIIIYQDLSLPRKHRKGFKKCSRKVSKSFWRRKKKKQEYGDEQNRNLSEDEKEKYWEYGQKQHKNFPKDVKQVIVEYRKKYFKIWKNKYILFNVFLLSEYKKI